VIEVKVIATLQILGLDAEAPKNWHNYNVPLANGGTIPLLADNTLVRLRAEEIELENVPMLRHSLDLTDSHALDLDRLLKLGTKSKLRIMVTASSAYTHATTTKIAYYRRDDFAKGRFRKVGGKAGLQIAVKSEKTSGRCDRPGDESNHETDSDADATSPKSEGLALEPDARASHTRPTERG
jgi:hypothetical protein